MRTVILLLLSFVGMVLIAEGLSAQQSYNGLNLNLGGLSSPSSTH